MNFAPPNAPMGSTSYQQGPNYQQYPQQKLDPCIKCDKLEHIATFCPDVCTNKEQGIVHHNVCGRQTLGQRGGNKGEICGHRPERWYLSMGEYVWQGARQGQQGGVVATTAAPQLPQRQHVARSLLFQRASVLVTAFRSGIAWLLWEIDGYYSGRPIGKEY